MDRFCNYLYPVALGQCFKQIWIWHAISVLKPSIMFVTCKHLFIHPWDMALEPKIFIASCWQRWQMTCPGCRRRSHWGNDYTAHLFWRHGRPDQTMTDGGDSHSCTRKKYKKYNTFNVFTISVSWYFPFPDKVKRVICCDFFSHKGKIYWRRIIKICNLLCLF